MRTFFKIFYIFISLFSMAKTSAMDEDEYQIQSSFIINYTCYIQIQKVGLDAPGPLMGIKCREYLARYYRENLRRLLSYSDFRPVFLERDQYLRWSVIHTLRKDLEDDDSLYGSIMKRVIVALLSQM